MAAGKLIGNDGGRLQEVTAGDGLVLTGNDLSVNPVGWGYDIGMNWLGTIPIGPFQVIFAVIARDIRLLAGLPGSQALAVTPPSAGTVVFDIENGNALPVKIGEVTFTTGSGTGVFTWATDQDFAPGDNLSIRPPLDTKGMTDIGLTFKGITI